MSIAVNLLDARSLLGSFGTIGIALVLFAETGLLIGLFLPGDSLLFTAGLFAAAGASAPVRLSCRRSSPPRRSARSSARRPGT